MVVTTLKTLRESRANATPPGEKLTQKEVARQLNISLRTYCRDEKNNRVPVERRDELARILGVNRGQLDAALHDATNGGLTPVTQTVYVSLEQRASALWAFQPWTVQALLQTSRYAAAVERSDIATADEATVERRVESRVERQRVLYRNPDPLELSVVLDESVLFRITGSREVMAAQLAHLETVAELPNIDLRVLPLTSGIHLASMRSFALIASEGAARAQIVCTPDGAQVRYDEAADRVAAHVEMFAFLRSHALTAPDSVALISRTNKERYT